MHDALCALSLSYLYNTSIYIHNNSGPKPKRWIESPLDMFACSKCPCEGSPLGPAWFGIGLSFLVDESCAFCSLWSTGALDLKIGEVTSMVHVARADTWEHSQPIRTVCIVCLYRDSSALWLYRLLPWLCWILTAPWLWQCSYSAATMRVLIGTRSYIWRTSQALTGKYQSACQQKS